MLSEDPMGHAQSTNDKQSSGRLPNELFGTFSMFYVLNKALNIYQEPECEECC